MARNPVPRPGAWIVLAILALVATMVVLTVIVAVVAGWLCARHPLFVTAAVLTASTAAVVGLPAVVALWVLVVGGALALRAQWRASFDLLVLRRWRRTFVY